MQNADMCCTALDGQKKIKIAHKKKKDDNFLPIGKRILTTEADGT